MKYITPSRLSYEQEYPMVSIKKIAGAVGLTSVFAVSGCSSLMGQRPAGNTPASTPMSSVTPYMGAQNPPLSVSCPTLLPFVFSGPKTPSVTFNGLGLSYNNT